MQAEKELEDLLAVKRSTSHDSSAQLKPEDQLFLLSRAKVTTSSINIHGVVQQALAMHVIPQCLM